MSFATRKLTVSVGGHDYRLRALSDRQQYCDADGAADRAGISSAQWCLFGQSWPSGHVLAEAMSRFAVAGVRILEIGCGLGLPSLVLKRRGADVTASDHHPLVESFLEYNAVLNGLEPIAYHDLPWAIPDAGLGFFDLIIGSDILYERDHPALLSGLLLRHAGARAQIVITDPGRGLSAPFTRAMQAQGYACSTLRTAVGEFDVAPFRGRLLSFQRLPEAVAEGMA